MRREMKKSEVKKRIVMYWRDQYRGRREGSESRNDVWEEKKEKGGKKGRNDRGKDGRMGGKEERNDGRKEEREGKKGGMKWGKKEERNIQNNGKR